MTTSSNFSPPILPSPRATTWALRSRKMVFGRLPALMGILNVTPDSFSDGGKFHALENAVQQGLRLEAEGADLIDIGGESTRPYSDVVTEEEELRRVIPVIQALAQRVKIPISIDTSKARVAREALQAGAEVINDITGLEGDPHMVAVAVETGAGVCAMHMQGTPQTMQDSPTYKNVVQEIHQYLAARRDWLSAQGILPEKIALDPGIGFGKTHDHNLMLLANIHQFHDLGSPLLVGHSRKGFIAKILGNKEMDRTAGTVGASLCLANQGVQILRVHSVAAVRQALLLYEATGGFDGQPKFVGD